MEKFFEKLHAKLNLATDDSVTSLEKLSSGWYLIKRSKDPISRRYNLAVKKYGFNKKVIVYDYNGGKTTTFMWNQPIALDLLEEDDSVEKLVKPMDLSKYLDNNELKDNGYLEAKGLTAFDISAFNIVTINYHAKMNRLLIPYTNFDLFPQYVGAKLVGPKGEKSAIRNSVFKKSFHAHRYDKTLKTYIIGEGYPECAVAAVGLTYANVLEAGGVHNVLNLLKYLTQDADNIIYVMAEHGSEEVYSKIQALYPAIKVNYPPTTETKDFGDYFLKEGLSKTKEAILGLLLEQAGLGYKPLGIEGTKVVFYSKVLNSIVKLNPENTESIYRLSSLHPWAAHKIAKKDKEAAISALFMECAQCGTYSPDNVLPVGLWKNTKNNNYYYNDGSKVLKILDDKLEVQTYSSVIDSDFLLHKVPNVKPIQYIDKFTAIDELVELFGYFDWIEDLYAKILLGFLAQTYYAGAIDFRPHVWLMSETTHAGKSWIANWCKENLVTNGFTRESGRSSTSGTSQMMADLAGLLVCDEFAEKNSSYLTDAKRMIELLRSASTAAAPIVLGTPEQKPIRGHIKFSALLACIEGEALLEQQDFDRIIMLNLGKKKGHFEKDKLPKFNAFIEQKKNRGFASHCLSGFYLYKKLYPKLHVKLTGDYQHIGHKARGLASVMAGFAAFCRSEKPLESFLDQLDGSIILKGYTARKQLFREREDIVEQILRTVITEKYAYIGETVLKTVLQLLTDSATEKAITPLGIKLKGKLLNIYVSEFSNFNNKYLKLNRNYLYKKFTESKYFVKISNSYFNHKKTRYFQFDLTSYIQDGNNEENSET